MNSIAEVRISFHSWAFVSQLRLSSEELGNRLQTPTLIGCKFLRNRGLFTFLSCFTVISEALYYDTILTIDVVFWNFRFFQSYPVALKETPHRTMGRLHCNSLTMTYFHTGTRTIIGAEAFHCPVRDGKEWYHFAMVVRHNCLPSWFGMNQSRRPIYRANQLHRFNEPICIGFLNASTWHNFLDLTIKVIGSSRTSN